MLALAHLQQCESHERAMLEVKWPPRRGDDPLTNLGLGRHAHIDERYGQRQRRSDDLDGPPLVHDERGAQRLVPPDESAEGLFQGRRVQVAPEVDRGSDVIGRVTRLELVQEPELFLGKRKRDVLLLRVRRGHVGAAVAVGFDEPFEQLPPLGGECPDLIPNVPHESAPLAHSSSPVSNLFT